MHNYTEVKERTSEPICVKHIKFLECLADTWPIKLEMLKAEQNNDFELAEDLKKEFIPVVNKAKPFLNEILSIRLLTYKLYMQNKKFREQENERCAEDFIHWVNYWVWTSDPRLPPIGLPNEIPLVLWPKQEEFLLWVHDRYQNQKSWLAEKSRGWGLTWLLSAYNDWHFCFDRGYIGGLGSRDKEAVDKIGDPDTIFSKVRYILYRLPPGMLPESYQNRSVINPSKHDNYLRIVNYEKDNVIRGEGGDDIGAGGRASMYVVDESALIQHPEKIDDSLSYNTNCRGDLSTVRGMNHFGEKRHSGRVQVFTAWFYQDPSKYKGWRENRMPGKNKCPFLEHEFLEKGELVVNQELLIDYQRSVENSFIPGKWVPAAIDFDLPEIGSRQSGFDVAAGGENKSVYTFRVGPVVYPQKELPFDTVQEALEEALNHAEDDNSQMFSYDHDGIGETVWGHIKYTKRQLKFRLHSIKNNASASETYLFNEGCKACERFRNKRTENMWNLRERFRKTYEHRNNIRHYDYSELISIPNDKKLTTQISQPKRVYSGAKIGVESKKEMKTRGVKSPDYLDSLADAFSDPDDNSMVVNNFNYEEGAGNIVDFTIDHENPIGNQYVAVVQTEDMMVYALCCLWINKPSAPLLRVYHEVVMHSSEYKKLIANIKHAMHIELKPIREWICNEEMMNSLEANKASQWFLWKKEGVNGLRKNYIHDYKTSIVIVNQMFKNRIIEVHPRCERVWMQLSNWRVERGKPRENMGFAMGLCQLVTRLRTKKEIIKEYISPQWKPKRPYKGSIGHFGSISKEEPDLPSYYRLAKSQVRKAQNNYEKVQ